MMRGISLERPHKDGKLFSFRTFNNMTTHYEQEIALISAQEGLSGSPRLKATSNEISEWETDSSQAYGEEEKVPLDKPEYNKRNKTTLSMAPEGRPPPLFSLNRLEFRNFGRVQPAKITKTKAELTYSQIKYGDLVEAMVSTSQHFYQDPKRLSRQNAGPTFREQPQKIHVLTGEMISKDKPICGFETWRDQSYRRASQNRQSVKPEALSPITWRPMASQPVIQ